MAMVASGREEFPTKVIPKAGQYIDLIGDRDPGLVQRLCEVIGEVFWEEPSSGRVAQIRPRPEMRIDW